MPDQQTSVRRERAGAVTAYASGGLLLAAGLMTTLLGTSRLFIGGGSLFSPDWGFRFSAPMWGWVHVGLGLLMALCAIAVVFRWAWGRFAGITLALVSMVVFFLWLPHYPMWSIVMIALDVVIVWAVATWDRPTSRDSEL